MAYNHFQNVCEFLGTKKINIQPYNPWLKSCIEWFVSQNTEFSVQEIQVFTFNQLLLADLNLVAQACLPPIVIESHATKLQGIYFLQINYFLDVGQSAYSQCQKIMKRDLIEGDYNDDNQVGKTFWMKPPNRMLKMEMTDGVRTVYGMEYSSIPKLNSGTMLPGVKVLVKGPVECRCGVIMLQENNIDILGGEVDALYEVNHVNRLIARKLNVDEHMLPLNDELALVPEVPVHSSVEQNYPLPTVAQLPSVVNTDNFSTRNFNYNNCGLKQENVNDDYLFQDSDIFFNVPDDHLLPTDAVNVKCEPTGNRITEINPSAVTFKSNLSVKNDNWFLIVKLDSNEGSVKASFDPDLLDRIIGFSPTELNSKENEIVVNPAIKETMNQMLKRSQQMIKRLSCPMTLAQDEGDELPVIIAISDESIFFNSNEF